MEKKRRRGEKKRLAKEEAKRKAKEELRVTREEAECLQREKEELEKAKQVEKVCLEREAAYKAKVEAGKKTKATGSKWKGTEENGEEGPAPKKNKTTTACTGKGNIHPNPKLAIVQQQQATPSPSNQDRAIDMDGSSSDLEVDEWTPGNNQDSRASIVAGPRMAPTRREKGKGVEKEKMQGNYHEQGQKVKMGGKNKCKRCRRLGQACKAQEADNKYACESCNQAKQKCIVLTNADIPEHKMMSLLLTESCMSRTATISLLNEVRGLQADITKWQVETAKTLKGLNKAVGDFMEEFQEFYDRMVKMGHLLDDNVFELAQEKKSEKGADVEDSGEDMGDKAGDREHREGETGEV